MNYRDYLIVYVDDEWSNRIVFEQSFGADLRVKTVAFPSEALETLKLETVAVLITDQRMAEMSGNDLLGRAKALCPGTIRVVLTAYGDLDPILRAVNEGLVARYLVKPWDRAELAGVLRWAIEAYVLGKESSELQLRLLETERLATIGSLGASIVHDLLQPLSYLGSGATRLEELAVSREALLGLLKRYGNELSPRDRTNLFELSAELGEIAHDMSFGCGVMREITSSVKRLLLPSPIAAEPLCDPLPSLRYAVSMCRRVAVDAYGSLDYQGPERLPRVRIGAPELTQVLINLCSNACQALERRDQRGGRVSVAASVVAGRLCLVVSDDGPGMAAEVLAKVGTLFFSTRAGGTGLGFSQCRRLVEGVQGELSIESELGKGTNVTVLLPLVDDDRVS